MVRQTLFRTLVMGAENTAVGFYIGGEKASSTLIQHGQGRVYRQGAGWWSVDAKLLRGNIRVRDWGSG